MDSVESSRSPSVRFSSDTLVQADERFRLRRLGGPSLARGGSTLWVGRGWWLVMLLAPQPQQGSQVQTGARRTGTPGVWAPSSVPY